MPPPPLPGPHIGARPLGARARVAHALLSAVLAARPILAMPVPVASPITVFGHGGEPAPPRTHTQLVFDLLSIAGLVLLGGVFAGLTLGLMGLDMVNLQVLSTSGSEQEQREARIVLNLLEKGRHWVLVVLLLGNVIVNETLPVFLSDFGGGLSAVLTSTLLIVVFGEIVPQAICARYGLSIGAYCAPMVHAVMILLAPIAWPTAKLLDWCLGEEQGTVYRKAELKTFVSLHQALGEETLTEDEVTIIRAVLDLNQKDIRAIMTPIADVYTLPSDAVLDEAGIAEIVRNGYSRIPVHEPGKPDAVLGMLLVKNLISYDPEDAEPVARFQLAAMPEAPPELTLFDCLNYFQQGRSHMLLVSDYPGESRGALGVVTLEDVIEEMIGREIVDEFDVYLDVHNKVKVVRPQPHSGSNAAKEGSWQPLIRGIIERRRKVGPARRSTFGLPSAPASGGGAGAGKPTSPLIQSNGGTNYGTLSFLANAPLKRRVQIKRTATWTPEDGPGPRPRSNSAVSTGDLVDVPERAGEGARRLSGPASGGRSQSVPPSPPHPISSASPAKLVAETSATANQPLPEDPEAESVDVQPLSSPPSSAAASAPGRDPPSVSAKASKHVTIEEPGQAHEEQQAKAEPVQDVAVQDRPAQDEPAQGASGQGGPEQPAQAADDDAPAPSGDGVSATPQTAVEAAEANSETQTQTQTQTQSETQTQTQTQEQEQGGQGAEAGELSSGRTPTSTSTPHGSLSRGTGKKNKKKNKKRK